jgi:DNA-binding MarR family transcriptional regulator
MTPQETALAFFKFSTTLRNTLRSGVSKDDCSLSLERFRCLQYLKDTQGATLTQASEDLGISSSSLCIMLKKLEQEGLVLRNRDTADRRVVRYAISSSALIRLEEYLQKHLAVLERRLEKLTPEDRQRLVASLDEVRRILSISM